LIPIRDENRSLSTPHLTRAIIIVNVVVFLTTWLSGYSFLEDVVWKFGMIPQSIMRGENLYTLFTSMFLHGGILHLFFNMLYLYIFGDNIEDAFGHGRYSIFYLLCGLVASTLHILTTLDPTAPTIGASGAISGVLGAYLVLYPRARIQTLVFAPFIAVLRVPAVFFLGFWFILQLFYGSLTLAFEVPSETAYWAHIGGFVAGIVLGLIVRRKRKRLKSVIPYYVETQI